VACINSTVPRYLISIVPTCPAHRILPHLTTVTTLGDLYEWLTSTTLSWADLFRCVAKIKTVKLIIISVEDYLYFSGIRPRHMNTFRLSRSHHQAVYKKIEVYCFKTVFFYFLLHSLIMAYWKHKLVYVARYIFLLTYTHPDDDLLKAEMCTCIWIWYY
jgi:hypothetical protein